MISINLTKNLHGAEGPFILNAALEIPKEAFIALSGKSGSGKTTLLRMLAGLETPDEGHIAVNGDIWFDKAKRINLPASKRRIGFVFQDYSLFPTMTVRQNLAFVARGNVNVDELLETVGLSNLSNRMPASLSGGQQQRVALARALSVDPQVLLLDEPLSALDPEMRGNLQDAIGEIHRNFGITTVMVSHDLPEMFKLATSIVEIAKGEILRQSAPHEFFQNRPSSQKFSFTGEILSLREAEVIVIAVIAIGTTVSEVVISKEQARELKAGDRVVVASKAFNPVLKKIL